MTFLCEAGGQGAVGGVVLVVPVVPAKKGVRGTVEPV